MECSAEGRLAGGHVLVWRVEEARCLYASGFYGHPLGVDKPRGADFHAPLLLTLLEALYLSRRGTLRVIDDGGVVPLERLEEEARRRYGEQFEVLYTVYSHLRDRGLVVRSGLVYGAEFTVYRYGPGIDHAPYVVHVYPGDHMLEPTDIIRAGRLSHSVKKTFIMATRDKGGAPIYLMLKWFRP